MREDPLYPFGFGLSYSKFAFSALKLDKEMIKADEKIALSVKVENRGDFDADEVVQLYITVPDESGLQPLWSLKDFRRVHLKKGGSEQLHFELDRESLEQYGQGGEARVLPGEYTVYIGNASPGRRSLELGAQVVSTNFRVKK